KRRVHTATFVIRPASHAAITVCTAAALFVCVLVAMLFLADPAEDALARPIAGLFVLTMLLLIVGLSLFLWEKLGCAMPPAWRRSLRGSDRPECGWR
ncbi:MAG: DUF2721 domain-containing protein, partial [Allosphingosinicella sp.]